MIVLHPKGKGPKPATPEERFDYQPELWSESPEGFLTEHCMAWVEGEGRDLCVVVLEQHRPMVAELQWIRRTKDN